MSGRASTLLGVMTVVMLMVAGASFLAAGDRAMAIDADNDNIDRAVLAFLP